MTKSLPFWGDLVKVLDQEYYDNIVTIALRHSHDAHELKENLKMYFTYNIDILEALKIEVEGATEFVEDLDLIKMCEKALDVLN